MSVSSPPVSGAHGAGRILPDTLGRLPKVSVLRTLHWIAPIAGLLLARVLDFEIVYGAFSTSQSSTKQPGFRSNPLGTRTFNRIYEVLGLLVGPAKRSWFRYRLREAWVFLRR